jgi:hypothetical protein
MSCPCPAVKIKRKGFPEASANDQQILMIAGKAAYFVPVVFGV